MRCATHGLAAGPDGACVLCRSGGKRAKAGSNAPLVALVAAVLLVGVTAAAFRFLGERPGLPERERAASTLARATPAPAPQVEESAQAPAVAPGTPGSLVVDSRPPDARVFVDGREIGRTPVTLPNVPPGEHVVRIERDGYQTISTTTRVEPGARARVAVSLTTERPLQR